MGAATSIDKEINRYLNYLSIEQKKVLLSVVKNFTHEDEVWEENEDFLSEMEQRFKDLDSGNVKGISFGQLKNRIRQSHKNGKRPGK